MGKKVKVKVKVKNELIKRHKTTHVQRYGGAGYVTINHCFQTQQRTDVS